MVVFAMAGKIIQEFDFGSELWYHGENERGEIYEETFDRADPPGG